MPSFLSQNERGSLTRLKQTTCLAGTPRCWRTHTSPPPGSFYFCRARYRSLRFSVLPAQRNSRPILSVFSLLSVASNVFYVVSFRESSRRKLAKEEEFESGFRRRASDRVCLTDDSRSQNLPGSRQDGFPSGGSPAVRAASPPLAICHS